MVSFISVVILPNVGKGVERSLFPVGVVSNSSMSLMIQQRTLIVRHSGQYRKQCAEKDSQSQSLLKNTGCLNLEGAVIIHQESFMCVWHLHSLKLTSYSEFHASFSLCLCFSHDLSAFSNVNMMWQSSKIQRCVTKVGFYRCVVPQAAQQQWAASTGLVASLFNKPWRISYCFKTCCSHQHCTSWIAGSASSDGAKPFNQYSGEPDNPL